MAPTIKSILRDRMAHEYTFMVSHPDGWDSIVEDIHNEIIKLVPDYKVIQTKEKFGGLRFSIDIKGVDEDKRKEVMEIIQQAAKASYKTCADCGSEGKLRDNHGWKQTLCDRCNALDKGQDILTWEDEGGLDPETL